MILQHFLAVIRNQFLPESLCKKPYKSPCCLGSKMTDIHRGALLLCWRVRSVKVFPSAECIPIAMGHSCALLKQSCYCCNCCQQVLQYQHRFSASPNLTPAFPLLPGAAMAYNPFQRLDQLCPESSCVFELSPSPGRLFQNFMPLRRNLISSSAVSLFPFVLMPVFSFKFSGSFCPHPTFTSNESVVSFCTANQPD